jgi:hypothetical protein
MEIKFADSFGKSIKKMIWHQHPVYKFYELFRYKIPMFFKNLWFFRKELFEYRKWDYTFNLGLLRRSLEGTVDYIDFKGWEIDSSRLKKVAKMRRAIEILNNIESHTYIEMAETKLGKLDSFEIEFERVSETPELYQLIENETESQKKHRRSVYDLSEQLEKDEWNELWTILRGQDRNEYNTFLDSKEVKNGFEWDEWFDGSGMDNWWD